MVWHFFRTIRSNQKRQLSQSAANLVRQNPCQCQIDELNEWMTCFFHHRRDEFAANEDYQKSQTPIVTTIVAILFWVSRMCYTEKRSSIFFVHRLDEEDLSHVHLL